MEAIIKTNNKNLFDSLLLFLKSLHITVETKEERKTIAEKTKQQGIDLNSFSFFQSMEASKNFKGSLSDALIEERRSE